MSTLVFESLIYIAVKYSDWDDWPECVCPFQNYDHLFKVNDKSVGGSFYLQSKVSNGYGQNIVIVISFCFNAFILVNPIWKPSRDGASLCCFAAQVVRAKERLEEELNIQSEHQEKKKTPETWSMKVLLPHRSPSQTSVNYVLIKYFPFF